MDQDDIFAQAFAYLLNTFPRTPWGILLMAWLVLAQVARFIQSKVLPPRPGSWLVYPWKLITLLSWSRGYAVAAYGIGKKSIFVPVGTDRVEAARAIGYDPATTSPHYKALPKPIGTADEANALAAEKPAQIEPSAQPETENKPSAPSA